MATEESIDLERLYTHLGRDGRLPGRDRLRGVKQRLLPFIYWSLAHTLKTPGLPFQTLLMRSARKLARAGGRNLEGYRQMVTLPMDSVRYFEFDFMWRRASGISGPTRYLDVSSPRSFPLMMLESHPLLQGEVINPDLRDLQLTRELFECCGLAKRCSFRNVLVHDLALPPQSFDLVTSISVVEHIPGEGDREAVEKMWTLVRPGGKLLISVPCAARAFEEYLDYDEYGLLEPDSDNYVFGQRFYDDALLQERIFAVTGPPLCTEIYGEKRAGFLIRNREEKVNDPDYAFWREPYLMGQEFAFFGSIGALPGWGVVAMEFCKPK